MAMFVCSPQLTDCQADVALSWFNSYMTNRTQAVIFKGIQFTPSQLSCGVPQGSVLGPLEFITYIQDLYEVCERHSIRYHLYADDKQMYMSVRISEVDAARQRLIQCIKDIHDWCASRRLQLNASKTELVWLWNASQSAEDVVTRPESVR